MWRVERKVYGFVTFLRNDNFYLTEAVQRITGAYVAFMRPPYGSYNQMVLDASGIRGQSVAIWDFEFVFSIIPF